MIDEFTIGCSRTVNLGNYESLKIEASVTMTIDNEDEFEATKEKAQLELRRLMEETYRAQHKKNGS